MSTTPQYILKRIEEAKAKKHKKLDLSNRLGQKLTKVPEEVFELNHLEELDLRDHAITTIISDEFKPLRRLKILDLRGNPLKQITDINGLILDFEIYQTLKTQLRPRQISGLRVKLDGDDLPDEIFKLRNLRRLDLSDNQLSSVPESITQLQQLTKLDLSVNQLNSVPESIRELKYLNTLELEGNPLQKPPLEIAVKGIEEIRDYFRQLEEEGVDYLYEAKLLMVGESGVDKTTLVKKIENPDYVLQKEEASTKGIEVITWHFPLENGRQFRVNIWEFDEQEIDYAMHQFFLTKRTLYALVADTRQKDTYFYHWLNVVKLLRDESPVLIIQNERPGHKEKIPEQQLRRDFSFFETILYENFQNIRKESDVLKKIKNHIENLPHVRSPLPKTWVKVRKALEDDKRNCITLNQYFTICEDNGLMMEKHKLQLSGYLHDLGICLHFQDDPELKDFMIIKPGWVINAAYRVLNNPEVRDNQAKFGKAALKTILHEQKDATKRDKLLKLFFKFDLCYKLKNTEWYMVPQLLRFNGPNHPWDGRDNLLLRYKYEFMPKGVMSRFIVAMHHLIAEQRDVWYSGVVLQYKQTKAEVTEDSLARQIKVKVVGQQKKELRRMIRDKLEQIHRSFNKLDYFEYYSCNCEKCNGEPEPHFYDLKTLLGARDHGEQIQCIHSRQWLDVEFVNGDVEITTAVEIRSKASIDQDRAHRPPQKPLASSAERNPHLDPPTESEKNKVFLIRKKIRYFFTQENFEYYLAFFAGVLTVSHEHPWVKSVIWLGLIIFAVLVVLLNIVSNGRIRVREICFLVMIGLFAWFTWPPNLTNSCPDIALMVSPTQIEHGQTADLTVFPFPTGDPWNYTWKAEFVEPADTAEPAGTAQHSGLKRSGEGAYSKPNNEYTAPRETEKKKVKITVEVDDNQCGKPVSQEVSIPILLPD